MTKEKKLSNLSNEKVDGASIKGGHIPMAPHPEELNQPAAPDLHLESEGQDGSGRPDLHQEEDPNATHH